MINVFAVFTGKLLQTLQNSSFHKTCYLGAKTKRFPQFCKGTVILPFLKIGHHKRFCCFYWKTAANTSK